jgi:2-polyprenyl-3-methyl-5-hydroxy-6-metoxy-1,4-benzoquinol methylase
MENVNDTYFDGYYKDIWKAIIPEILTEREITFILEHFKVNPSSHVLDLMCGYGRHAIGLARKGIPVTAVDNLQEYISEIKKTATEENLPISAIQSPVLDYATTDKFDLVLCMGNSLNFFNELDTMRLLTNISDKLKKGGHLLINTWSLAEIAIKGFVEESTSNSDGFEYQVSAKYLFRPARIEAEHLITAPDGKKEIKKAVDYIFSVNEMERMINLAGLSLLEVYGIPGRKQFTLGAPRAYLTALKN